MRLVFIHGIAQQDFEAEALEADWKAWLRLGMSDPSMLDGAEVKLAYYATVLDELTDKHRLFGIIPMGEEQQPTDEDLAMKEAMDEIAMAEGLTKPQIAAKERELDNEVVPQGWIPMSRRINAILRLLEDKSPLHGAVAQMLVKQAYEYLRHDEVRDAVGAIVKPELTKGRMVLVTHSLGTVVGFRLLRELAAEGAPVDCPLLVTMGSPLAMRAVSSRVRPPFEIPAGVGRWINTFDPTDVVTLGKSLDDSTFCAGICNFGEVDNSGEESPHAARGYLRHKQTADAIAVTLGS
jgi:hypothetical protein